VQILLPLQDNQGKPLVKKLFRSVAEELSKRFGGLTAHTRAPAEGLWKQEQSNTDRDEIVIYEVMTDELDTQWWKSYRQRLEKRFRQKCMIIRALAVRSL
jgi:hypothetical protein